MIKQISITFDFNTETEEVSNIKTVGSSEKKKTTTKKVKEVVEELAAEPLITLEPNKLVFNNKSIADMELNYEDRIIIKWIKENKLMIPIIGKDIAFDEEGSGNKVTKSNTVTYKGKSNTVLAEHGTEFTLLPYDKEGIWKLVSLTQKSVSEPLEDLIEQASNEEPILLVDTDDTDEIDELQFKL